MDRSAPPDHPWPCRRAPGSRTLRAAVLAGAAGLLLVLTACTGSATSSSAVDTDGRFTAAGAGAAAGTAAATAAPAGAPEAAGNAADDDDGGAASAAGAATVPAGADAARAVPAAADTRQIIRTAELGVRLPVPSQGSADADAEARSAALHRAVADGRAAVVAAGGLVASSDGSGDRTTLGLRVPVEAYDGTLERLSGLGAVDVRTESSQDVTTELVDVASRIQSMTASVERVRALLAQATDLGQVVTIEGELARREADLESLQRQQASLAGQVALSTITLTLTAVTTDAAPAPTEDPNDTGFLAGLHGGWSALLTVLTGVGTAAGALLPFLPVIAAAAALLWWARRRRRRPSGVVASSVTGDAAATR